ncbi:hypothetical protein [Rhodocista pekingensis]|uniref:Uncharacterized protein n=1 Tax=Rhodocista pekingensis TaxID=201185 RepID=A0ABW2KXL2_9PROT
MTLVLLLGIAGLVLAGALWLLSQPSQPSDDDILARFDAIDGFTVTERHAHDGSGLAADETCGRIAVLGKGRPQMVLLGPRDLAAWHYLPKDGAFEMELTSRRHPQPFVVSFRRSATADEWIRILKKTAEGR